MRKIYSTVILATILLYSLLPAFTFAQSGRGRPTNPARDPKPANAPPVTVPDATSVIKQEQAANLARFVLKNGITVIINEQHATPIAATVAYFKAGRVDESDAVNGAASLLARLLLRGTQFRSGEQIANELRAIGAVMEVQAGYDYTAFPLLVQPEKIKEALAIQADVLQHPALNAEDVRKEIVLNEDTTSRAIDAVLHRRNAFFDADDNSFTSRETTANYALERLVNVAFTQSKQGRVWQKNQTITGEQLLEFYRAQYRPDNLIITVTGDVSTFNTLVEIQRLYGAFKTTPVIQDATTNTQQQGDNSAKPTDTSAATPSKAKLEVADKAKTSASGVAKKTNPTVAAPSAQTKSATKPPSTQTATPNGKPPTTPNGKPQATEAQTAATTNQQTAQTPQTPLKYANERGNAGQSIISVGYRLANLDAKERATIEVLATLLGQGRASRLARSLVEGQALATHLDANYLTMGDAGLLAVQMALAPSLIDRAESAFFKDVNRLRREIPSEGEMTRAKMLLEKRFFDRSETYLDRAWLLARTEATQDGLRALVDYRKRIQAVTAADVQRAAAKYLTFDNTAVFEYEARTAAPRTFDVEKYATTVMAWAPTYAEAVDAKQVRATDDKNILATNTQSLDKSTEELSALESIQPLPVKNFSTLNGPQAYVREDHSQPRLNIAILFQGGRMIEDESNGGVTELMLRTMLHGTARRTQVAQELEQMGADIEIVSEADFYGIQVSVLSHYAARVLRIVRELIEEPAFREEDVKLALDEQLALIQSERDSNIKRSGELFWQALVPNHAYSLPTHGREEVLKKMTGESLQTWHSRTIKRQLPAAIVVGDTEGSAIISGDVANGFKRNDTDATLKARVPQVVKPGEIVEPSKSAKTAMTLGFSGAKGSGADLSAIEVLKFLLNGNSGRLVSELRNKQGLAFDVCVDNKALLITGAIYAQALVAPENEQRLRAALTVELEKLSKTNVSAEELSGAKAVGATVSLLRLQSQRARTMEYAKAVFYQREAAEVDNFEERLSKITAEEVKRAAAAYFKPATVSVGIVRGTQMQK